MKKLLTLAGFVLAAMTTQAQNIQRGDYGYLYCHMSDRGEYTAYALSRDGYHYEFRFAYDDESAPTVILKNWIEVEDPPPPPRTFSKIRLKGAIAEAGLLDEFKAMLEQVDAVVIPLVRLGHTHVSGHHDEALAVP